MIFTPNMKIIVTVLLLISGFVNSQVVLAQKAPTNQTNRIDSLSLDSLNDIQFRLLDLGRIMITSSDEQERLTSAYHFVKSFVRALRISNSYFYNFDTIKNISVLESPDNKFRVLTWNLALNNETFRNYGVIQLNPDYIKTIKDTSNLRPYYPLIDKSELFKNALDTTVDNEHWYGALYYKIVANTYKKQTYYTLLGWDGNTKMSNKKIVESLYFENNKPRFGAPIFDLKDKRFKHPLKRMIFEFNNSASMVLRFEPTKSILVQENVAPTRPEDYGHPETYVPDGSYDFYKFSKKTGKWEKQTGMLSEFDMQK